jgi:hypothetical protein
MLRRLVAAAALLLPALAGAAEPELRVAPGHRMQYLVSRPAGWKAGRTYPVVVAIDAAQREFRGNLAAFIAARGDRPFILVAPFVVTGGGARYRESPAYPYQEGDWKAVTDAGPFAFDEAGIRAVLDDVARRDSGEPRAYLTGWEAGGHTVWALTFRHPEWWAGVAPVTTNYLGRWLDDQAFSNDPARARLAVHVLMLDIPEAAPLRTQTAEAIRVARAHGFGDVTLAEVRDRPHGPLAPEVMAWFAGLRPRP